MGRTVNMEVRTTANASTLVSSENRSAPKGFYNVIVISPQFRQQGFLMSGLAGAEVMIKMEDAHGQDSRSR
jgi:hypothetical protein